MTEPARNGPAASGGSSLVRDIYDVEILRRAAVAGGWSADYRQLGAGPLTVRSVAVQCADILMISQHADRSLEVVGEPPAGMLTGLLPASGDDLRVNGYSIRDSELIVLAPGKVMYSVTRSAVTVCAIQIPDSLFDASVRDLESHWNKLERGWVIPVPLGMGVLDSLRRLVLSADPLPSREAELASVLTRDLVPLINESHNVGPTRDRYGPAQRWQVLQRARAYIENHLGETIRMADLCRQVGASLKTVERVFQQELQMTPSAYVRVRRLNAVKKEIVARGAADKSITEIAMHHGFGHLGRFSAAYREHFGHLPSEAVRRAASLPGEQTPR